MLENSFYWDFQNSDDPVQKSNFIAFIQEKIVKFNLTYSNVVETNKKKIFLHIYSISVMIQ